MKYLFATAGLLVAIASAGAQTNSRRQRVVEQYAIASDGTQLNWTLFFPQNAGNGPFPVVLVIHTGGFSTGPRGPEDVSEDLASQGMIAAAIDYRLDKFGALPGQVQLAYAPNIGEANVQIDDVRQAILAARNPSPTSALFHVASGKVGALGGSSGASHALWCAVTGTPGWDRLDAAGLLSGPYAFDDSISLAARTVGCDNQPSKFLVDSALYCGLDPDQVIPNHPPPQLTSASPLYAINSPANVAPLYLVASERDPITPSQIVDLKQQLDRVHVRNYRYWVVTGSLTSCEHAFDYWFDPQDGTTINREVGGWLLSQLTGGGDPAKADNA